MGGRERVGHLKTFVRSENQGLMMWHVCVSQVRELLYLFVWSLMRERGTHLLHPKPGSGEGAGEEGQGGKEGEKQAKAEQPETPPPAPKRRKKGGAK